MWPDALPRTASSPARRPMTHPPSCLLAHSGIGSGHRRDPTPLVRELVLGDIEHNAKDAPGDTIRPALENSPAGEHPAPRAVLGAQPTIRTAECTAGPGKDLAEVPVADLDIIRMTQLAQPLNTGPAILRRIAEHGHEHRVCFGKAIAGVPFPRGD